MTAPVSGTAGLAQAHAHGEMGNAISTLARSGAGGREISEAASAFGRMIAAQSPGHTKIDAAGAGADAQETAGTADDSQGMFVMLPMSAPTPVVQEEEHDADKPKKK